MVNHSSKNNRSRRVETNTNVGDDGSRGGQKPLATHQRKIVIVVLVSILLSLAWNSVDANATLFVYDALLSATVSTKYRFRKFKEKTIWVTGASSGIGAEIVCRLVEAEAKHIVLSARPTDKLEQVTRDCRDRVPSDGSVDTKFSIVPFDAAEPDIDQIVQIALHETGGIDVLILNAGIYQVRPALETDLETVKRIMKVNFETPVALATALIQADKWKERGHGHLVVVSSITGRGANSLSSAYSASKHALRGYFHTLSTEEHSWLRVNVALPGATDTRLWTTAFDKTVKSGPATKMTAERSSRLILTGAVGPHFLFYETWIAKPLGLIWTYLSLFPNIFNFAIHFFGTLRVAAWKEDGSDTLDIAPLIHQMFKLSRRG